MRRRAVSGIGGSFGSPTYASTALVGASTEYSPEDVYNIDEMGLFYQMLPDRSITSKDHAEGTKKQKARITIALYSNGFLRNFKVGLYAKYRQQKGVDDRATI